MKSPLLPKKKKAPTDFSKVKFRGIFRDYQQTVLNNAQQHLADGKIHIVAAPGSGKTILGLELIRELGVPAIVLSPSVTIRQQWGERFEEGFLPEGEDLSHYVSFDLHDSRLITSVTYQALHAASCKEVTEESLDIVDSEDEGVISSTEDATVIEDFRDFDLVSRMKERGVRVLCLDEAHHLRSEWHKALMSFIKAMGDDLVIISLTATPPYDSTQAEWQRYVSLCGPIDEEIFVPELVVKRTLCPHQDYVYFSYPTTSEKAALKKYRHHTDAFLNEVEESHLIEDALKNGGMLDAFSEHLAVVLKNENEFFTLFRMAERFGVSLPPEVTKMIRARRRFKAVLPWRKSMEELEGSLQFIMDNPALFDEEISERLRTMAAEKGLIERKRLRLLANKKLGKMLVSSMGKLNGISQITLTETHALGDSLRMLILTDFIKEDMLHIVGTNAAIQTMGAVPIFEAVRRTVGEATNIALLSGSLVIVPACIQDDIKALSAEKGIPCTFRQLPEVEYCTVNFSGSNKNKVAVMTEAFRRGFITILIGTKSLLGEGWDSPCINSLILATFIGSFMLSNQMRGRAIRIDRDNPEKTATIWHLVTMEPVIDEDASFSTKLMLSPLERYRELDGADWETLVRRFDCFMGPAYSRPVIESGVERMDILTPPFDENGIEQINEQMVARATDRASMAQQWFGSDSAGFYPVVEVATDIPETSLPISHVLANALPIIFLALVEGVFGMLFTSALYGARGQGVDLLTFGVLLVALVVGGVVLVRGSLRLSRLLSPKRNVTAIAEAVLASLRQTSHIKSLGAKIRVDSDPIGSRIRFGLRQATIHEQSVFAQAMSEMLSPIENPKYVLIRKKLGRYHFWQSYSCPEILASKKEDAEVLRENMTHVSGNFELVFTYNTKGRELLWKSCCRSYVNANVEMLQKYTTWAHSE